MKKIVKLNTYMEKQVSSIKDNRSNIIDIVNLLGMSSEESELLLSECQIISTKIGYFYMMNTMLKGLLDKIEFEKLETFSSLGETMEISPPTSSKQISELNIISLKPQKDISSTKISKEISVLQSLYPFVEEQQVFMKELYCLSIIDYRYIDFSGIYPRINFLQDTPTEEIRRWYDFGAINSIYLSPPNFSEINLLPLWVKGVKYFYLNNPTVLPKDILVLKFKSAGPDFHQEEKYLAYHFMQIGKAESFCTTTPKDKKEYKKFEEVNIHYRRAIGIRKILQGLEGSFKNGFWTYGGKKIFSLVMISPTRKTPPSTER